MCSNFTLIYNVLYHYYIMFFRRCPIPNSYVSLIQPLFVTMINMIILCVIKQGNFVSKYNTVINEDPVENKNFVLHFNWANFSFFA